MTISTCIKCSGHSFELALFTPIGESRKLTLLQCAQCGTPAGALDPATGPQIEALKNQVADIDERLNRIAKALQMQWRRVVIPNQAKEWRPALRSLYRPHRFIMSSML